MRYPCLQEINSPLDIRGLSADVLPTLAAELRDFIQTETATKAGHIRSSLGVVELSIALHYYFRTPEDILIWDVGHQAYAHKVLCERQKLFASNRQKGGISGFTKRQESSYDPFGAGHSSTSISALAGFIKSADLDKIKRRHIAVIGDGALTGGQAFEALNYLGDLALPCLIILNDNQGSIDPNVGGLQANGRYRDFAESLGFQYLEGQDGNDLNSILEYFKEADQYQSPVFLHLHTQKGLGYLDDISRKGKPAAPSYQSAFEAYILPKLEQDQNLVILSPAMLAGAGLRTAQSRFPERVIDVGIAEQHVVTMAAALAADGKRVIVHLYSTFAQRAYDQIVHDVALQALPVVFILDRAGLVGEDGPTHHGVFDQSMLSDIPNLVLGAPAGAKALGQMLDWALEQEDKAVFLRYPKASYDPQIDEYWQGLEPHLWYTGKSNKMLISYGSLAGMVQSVAEESAWSHLHIPLYRPLDLEALRLALAEAEKLILVDENPVGGSVHQGIRELFSSGVLKADYQHILLPKEFVEHASRKEQLSEFGFSREQLLKLVLS